MVAKVKDTRWGLPLEQWRQAKEEARDVIIARARACGTITYAELCAAVTAAHFRHYSWALMALLDEVCDEQDPLYGIMLASLVVRRDTGMPGNGYFAWAERAGFDVSDREAFWRAETEKVWAAYRP